MLLYPDANYLSIFWLLQSRQLPYGWPREALMEEPELDLGSGSSEDHAAVLTEMKLGFPADPSRLIASGDLCD